MGGCGAPPYEDRYVGPVTAPACQVEIGEIIGIVIGFGIGIDDKDGRPISIPIPIAIPIPS